MAEWWEARYFDSKAAAFDDFYEDFKNYFESMENAHPLPFFFDQIVHYLIGTSLLLMVRLTEQEMMLQWERR